jgi:Flp pilus assembly protein TadD
MKCLVILVLMIALSGCSSLKSTKDVTGTSSSGTSGSDDILNDGSETGDTPVPPRREGQAAGEADSKPVRGLDQKYQLMAQAIRAGKTEQIYQEAAKVLGSDPHDPIALNALAMYQFRRGKLGAAKILLNKAFEKHPENASLHNNMGLIYLADGDYVSAVGSFKRALKTDDHNAEALGNLGSIYVQNHDYAKALPLLEDAYRLNKANFAVANNYAIALRANKTFDKAKDIYEDLIKQNSRDVSVLTNYATLLIEHMGKPKEGLAIVYKIKFLETDRKDVLSRANELEKRAKAEVK